jgi:cytochrome bd ubiquinol oxidase subunit I
MQKGELVFRGQCMNCHTVDGYRAMRRLMHGRDRKSIANIVGMLHEYGPTSPYRNFMPPLVGTPDEIDALAGYLDTLVNGRAAGAVVAQTGH